MPNANIEPELNSLRTKLAQEMSEDTKQIELLKKRIQRNEELLRVVKGRLNVGNDTESPGYGSKVEIVKNAISRLQDQKFTQDDVEEELRQSHPEMELDRNRIRATIWTICKKHKAIKLITKGSNKGPAEFEKVTNGTKSVAELGLVPSRRSPVPPSRPLVTQG